MARRVDQVESVFFSVLRIVLQPDGTRLDGDAAFLFQLHVVENLIFHDARFDRTALFDQAVGKRRLSVVDVGDDGEVANSALFCHSVSRSCSESNYYTPWSKPL